MVNEVTILLVGAMKNKKNLLTIRLQLNEILFVKPFTDKIHYCISHFYVSEFANAVEKVGL